MNLYIYDFIVITFQLGFTYSFIQYLSNKKYIYRYGIMH